jgi:hypothetical protein
VEVVPRRPARHRTLLDPVLDAPCPRLFQQRNEHLLEERQVAVHRQLLVSPHEPANRPHPELRRRVEHADHERVLLASKAGIVVQQVVKEGDIGDAHAGGIHGGEHALGARPVERLSQVQRVRDRVEQRLRRNIRLRRMQRRR